MLDLAFNWIWGAGVQIILLSLPVAGVVGFGAAWWFNFTRVLPSILAIPMAAVSLSLASGAGAYKLATDSAELRCQLKEEAARAEGQRAKSEALNKIIKKQRERAELSELAAGHLRRALSQTEQEKQNAQANNVEAEKRLAELENKPVPKGCIPSRSRLERLSR